MNRQDETTFKMIVIGAPGVGKSCLLNRFTKDQFREGYTATLGVQFFSKDIPIDDDTSIKAQIWDTAGQESFLSQFVSGLSSVQHSEVHTGILSAASFQELQNWYTQAMENCDPSAVFALIGAQKDRQLQRAVSLEQAENFMKDKDLAFMFETSSKTSENVQIAFREAAKHIILKKISSQMKKTGAKLEPEIKNPRNKCSC